MTPPKPLPTDIRSGPGRQRELSQHTPICVPCQRNYRCERNGIFVRLGPDAIISANLYQCPGCGNQIIRGFASLPVERHHGPYRALFSDQDGRMGNAAITDSAGCPIRPVQPDLIPAEDAPEAAAGDGHRWG